MSDLLNKASLVMIPSGYKEDVVYSAIPTDGSGDLSFTRASNGTRINSAGLVEVCPWNLLQYSEDFSNAVWVQQSNVVTSNSTTAPNGTTTADTISNTNTTALFRTYEGPITGLETPQTLAFSSYFKYKDHRYISFGITDDLVYRSQVVIDLQNMVITENFKHNSADTLTSTIESVGNGWYRVAGIFTYVTNLTGGSAYLLYKFQTSGTFNGSGTYQTGTGFYIWGAQLNIGSTAKPYFPTTDRLNVARLTYQNGGGGCPSLLLEKQSTNLLTYSEQFNNANWTNVHTIVTANQGVSPDGTQNADTVGNTGTNNEPTFYQLYSGASSSTVYTLSCFMKSNTHTKGFLRAYNGGSTTTPLALFDLSAGTVIASYGDATNAAIVSMGNGWYRCSMTFTTISSTVGIYAQINNLSNTYTYQSSFNFIENYNNTGSIYIYGAQLEASSYVTTLIPTTSSSATRVADVCSKTGISSLIGQTSGTVFVDAYIDKIEARTSNILFYLQGSGVDKYLLITSSGGVRYIDYPNGSIVNNSYGLTNGRHKFAIAYANNDFAFYIDGNLVGTDTSGTPSACSDFGFYYYASGYDFPLQVNEAILFPTRLTNDELASLTTI